MMLLIQRSTKKKQNKEPNYLINTINIFSNNQYSYKYFTWIKIRHMFSEALK